MHGPVQSRARVCFDALNLDAAGSTASSSLARPTNDTVPKT